MKSLDQAEHEEAARIAKRNGETPFVPLDQRDTVLETMDYPGLREPLGWVWYAERHINGLRTEFAQTYAHVKNAAAAPGARPPNRIERI